jgi:16S rRNA (cytidine1402-2'-O)-methyltransferase
MPTDRFCFEGFLPRQGAERRDRLGSVAQEERTVVLFEAPHRIRRTIDDLADACGPGRPIAIARELTKIHEEVWRGSLGEAQEWERTDDPRGEWVLVLAGSTPADKAPPDDDAIARALSDALAGGSDRRSAIAHVARALKVPKREVYRVEVERRHGI